MARTREHESIPVLSEADAAQSYLERYGELPSNLSMKAIRVLRRRGLPFKTVKVGGQVFVFYNG